MRVTGGSLDVIEETSTSRVLETGKTSFGKPRAMRGRLVARRSSGTDTGGTHSGELPSQMPANLQVVQNTQMRPGDTDSLSRDAGQAGLRSDRRRDSMPWCAVAGFPAAGIEPPPAAVTCGNVLHQLGALRRELQEVESHPPAQNTDRGARPADRAELAQSAGTDAERRRRRTSPLDELARPNRIADAERARERQGSDRAQRRRTAAAARHADDLKARIRWSDARIRARERRVYETWQTTSTRHVSPKEDAKIRLNWTLAARSASVPVLAGDLPTARSVPTGAILAGSLLGRRRDLLAWGRFQDVTLRRRKNVTRGLALPVLGPLPVSARSTPAPRRARRRRCRTMSAILALFVWITVGTCTNALRPRERPSRMTDSGFLLTPKHLEALRTAVRAVRRTGIRCCSGCGTARRRSPGAVAACPIRGGGRLLSNRRGRAGVVEFLALSPGCPGKPPPIQGAVRARTRAAARGAGRGGNTTALV